ncbi:hypothetical protein [Sphingobacterium griseoflavum]|uniref:Glycosyl hydrolases family 2 sugar binding domain-containing protein n=1 Tax=Sphingobacterium griseoflavum TaxID=1474952 RepID=A0ABQ3HWX2_9SPHI|nr:hypothetical protein [Sphingobacterium griseoflavum]GHE35858.1 hypothetical protein GCM10017764_18990 [Sphingobacterium griseoflavum]
MLLPICCLIGTNAFTQQVEALPNWISANDPASNKTSTWIAFRRDVFFKKKPRNALTRIAADTKYWLWINGELVVFEGGLKRGPNPNDSYGDTIDLEPYLKKGNNKIAILLWHFGKDGFSHVNSGKSGLLFHLRTDENDLISDQRWLSSVHSAYQLADNPAPNYRLPESNIRFDAQKDIADW